MTPEERLLARGLAIEEFDLSDPVVISALQDETLMGMVRLYPNEGTHLDINAVARPDLHPLDRESFADWAEERINRFFEHGSEPDGWYWHPEPGAWELWVHLREMPSMPEE